MITGIVICTVLVYFLATMLTAGIYEPEVGTAEALGIGIFWPAYVVRSIWRTLVLGFKRFRSS